MDDDDEGVSQVYMQTMCVCVPLRLGVLLVSTATFLYSCAYFVNTSAWTTALRQYVGGYALASSLAVSFMEVTGLIFGVLGILGAYFCRPKYIEVYNWWQLARILAMLFMYYIDVPLIMNCEMWASDVQGATDKYKWNQYLYSVAINGHCTVERSNFFIRSSILFVILMYTTWATSRYYTYMTRLPKHLIQVPKDLTSGAFYAHSLGERVVLNGEWGADGEWGDRERQPLLPPLGPMMGPPGPMMGPPGPMMAPGPVSYGPLGRPVMGPPIF